MKEQILTAGDGQQYKVTVTYDSTSGIPEKAVLEVTELNEDDPYFAEYVSRTNEILRKEDESVKFAHAFDISLVDPETGEHYQPNKDVQVSIELLTEEVSEEDDLSVVHFKGDACKSIEEDQEGKLNTGTLSEEERKEINEAVIETVRMDVLWC